MKRAARLMLGLVMIVPACNREAEPGRSPESSRHAAEPGSRPGDSTVSVAGAAGAPGASAAADTAPTTNGAPPKSPLAAVDVVNSYYNALQEGDFRGAYHHWVDKGAGSNQTFDEFKRGYSATSWVDVDTGQPGDVEGAAGSRYVKVPVVVSAGGSHGTELQCYTGNYTLSRSEVTGATEEQRHWRIHSADLKPCAKSSDTR